MVYLCIYRVFLFLRAILVILYSLGLFFFCKFFKRKLNTGNIKLRVEIVVCEHTIFNLVLPTFLFSR